jgi:DNA-directed RNA polymerase specialized sigma24 family protein
VPNGPGIAAPALSDENAAYALKVMSAFIYNGQISVECARRGRPLGEDYHVPAPQDIEDVVADTMLEGLRLFYLDAQWRPDGGRTPASYLVGACILCFPNVYRRYWRLRRRIDSALANDPLLFLLEGARDAARSAEASALGMETLTGALSEMLPLQRAALVLHAQGYSHQDTGELLGITPKAVEGQLRRGRQRLRARFAGRSAAAVAARS